MPRKLIGYILLSFLSFCFFTVIFNILATAQVSAQQSIPPIIDPELANPTPTIYNAPVIMPIQSNQVTNLSTPTPTIFERPQVKNTATQSDQNIQPTAATPVLPTTTPTPTDIPTITPSPSPSPSPQPTITTTTDLETLFSKYSAQYSVSEDELKKIANCESGFNTNSDTGLYAGMFQFSASTWASVRGLMGLDPNPDLRKDPEQAIMTTAFMLSRGEENAWPNCH